jgi:hypothetical protein
MVIMASSVVVNLFFDWKCEKKIIINDYYVNDPVEWIEQWLRYDVDTRENEFSNGTLLKF